MIQLTDRIWIGNSFDEEECNLGFFGITAVLNVAQDLQPTRGWDKGIEYAHVGLIDGPGNPISMYCSAILALRTLVGRRKVLVCCHTASRSLAVVIMYQRASAGQGWPGDWSLDWDGHMSALMSRVKQVLPVPRPAHREAFDRLCWRSLEGMMKD